MTSAALAEALRIQESVSLAGRLDYAVARAADQARNLAYDPDLPAGPLTRALDRASERATVVIREFAFCPSHFDADRACARARALACDLADADTRWARYCGVDLADACSLAGDLVDAVRQISEPGPGPRSASGRGGELRRPRLAGRLVAAAAALLPPGDRARYREEFRAELADIAAAGGQKAQMAYAARQVMSALRLRRALRAPQRGRAAP